MGSWVCGRPIFEMKGIPLLPPEAIFTPRVIVHFPPYLNGYITCAWLLFSLSFFPFEFGSSETSPTLLCMGSSSFHASINPFDH